MRGDKREQIKCWLQGCPDTFNPDINSNKIDIFKIPSLHQACFFLCFFLFLENVAEDDARSIDSIRHYYSVWPACWIVFSLLVFCSCRWAIMRCHCHTRPSNIIYTSVLRAAPGLRGLRVLQAWFHNAHGWSRPSLLFFLLAQIRAAKFLGFRTRNSAARIGSEHVFKKYLTKEPERHATCIRARLHLISLN